MFRSKTVIIVGAGASAEFGVPTGFQIFEKALKLPPKLDRHDSEFIGFAFQNGFDKHLMAQSRNGLWSKYEDFVSRVNNSAYPSIDRLAWINPDISDVCRAFSAWSILEALYTGQREHFTDYGKHRARFFYDKSNPHLYPIVNNNQNWIAATVNKWTGEAESASDLDSDSLTFVTFNYDRLIEEGFEHFIAHSRRFDGIEAGSLPSVLHVHGSFPEMPKHLDAQFVIDSQQCIQYIEDGGESETVSEARKRIDEAEYVVCVGFDFDPKNVALIGLEQHAAKLQVLNYDGNDALQNRVVSIGAQTNQILSGDSENGLGVSKAFGRGFLDRAELLAPQAKTAFVGLSSDKRSQ
ncbi:MAG: hypothetical protein AAGA89_12900 [Pseudomonadota bacterium]